MFRCGWSVLTSAGRNILRGKIFDENFLMTIATLGAIAIHELPEAVAVMLFFQVGELFQGFAAIAIARLKKVGVTETVMLTGDNRVVARNVADKLGLDTYKAELLPEDKVEAIEQYLRKSNKKSKVAFVGDGINDAPVIARADVGMAMGAFGSDAAIETADVVLMTDAPSKVAEAIAKLEFCFILD